MLLQDGEARQHFFCLFLVWLRNAGSIVTIKDRNLKANHNCGLSQVQQSEYVYSIPKILNSKPITTTSSSRLRYHQYLSYIKYSMLKPFRNMFFRVCMFIMRDTSFVLFMNSGIRKSNIGFVQCKVCIAGIKV